MRELSWLYLYENQLTGEIPPELGGLTGLRQLDLSGNQLSGAIPPELGRLQDLQVLYLENNRLTGEIPPELADLSSVRQLYLSNNRLTGEILQELGGLLNLNQLHLFGNDLTACVPTNLREVVFDPPGLTWLPHCEGTARTADPSECSNGIAVPDPADNPGLVSDCAVLLGVKDALAGGDWLTWSSEVPIAEWRFVTVGGSPSRVHELRLA